jgi:hypothetical protein
MLYESLLSRLYACLTSRSRRNPPLALTASEPPSLWVLVSVLFPANLISSDNTSGVGGRSGIQSAPPARSRDSNRTSLGKSGDVLSALLHKSRARASPSAPKSNNQWTNDRIIDHKPLRAISASASR